MIYQEGGQPIRMGVSKQVKNKMKHEWKSLLIVSYVFLFTGSIICMNDVLLPSLKEAFKLSYLQASFIQQSFYLVYLFFPIPIAFYISKYGYKAGLVTALTICSVGASLFIPAFFMSSYLMALSAVFVISIGVTLVNVAANPLAAMLGNEEGAHVRVNIVQLFSRIGYSFTPIFATRLIYGANGDASFHIPYVILGSGTLLLAMSIFFSKFPALKPGIDKGFNLVSIIKGSKKYPQLFWGAVIMFFYVGAEAGTAGFFMNYLQTVSGFSTNEAAQYLTYYYIASTLISFLGIYLLQFFSPGRLVTVFGIGMIISYLLAAFTTSDYNPYYLLSLGAFISIMFPCLFSLGIVGTDGFTEKGSALINIAIVGGAVFPPIQGFVADLHGVQFSYIVPCFCFVTIVMYGIYCERRSLV